MELVKTIAELRGAVDDHRRAGRSIGLVPTMGFLHRGHLSLVVASASANDITVTTIFVNPLQFAPDEDLDAYPRDPEGDAEKAAAAGSDYLFLPEPAEMYPEESLTTVTVAALSAGYEGESRPTHFAGVSTVVAKLFNIVGPCRAYFGEKDYQQLMIVRRMARDLDFRVEVIGCPTCREADGLALSSRNKYLRDPERSAAPVLHRALKAGAHAIRGGEADPAKVRNLMAQMVREEPLARLDYVDVVDSRTLEPVAVCDESNRLIGAAYFGRARLIDNMAVRR